MHEKHSFNVFNRDERLTCEAARPHLSELVDAALSEQDSATLQMHVASCLACAREVRTLAAADRVLQAQEEKEVPAHVWNALERKLRAEGLIQGSGAHPIVRAGHGRGLVALAHPVSLGVLFSIAAAAGLAAGATVPAMAALGAGLGCLVGFSVAWRGDRVNVLGLFRAPAPAVAAPLIALNVGALLLAGPAAPAVAAYAIAALPAFAGTLYARKRA